jgi:ketosteroid isomerase-like protein
MKVENKLNETGTSQMSPEWKRERILAFSAAWRRKDIEELMSYITDDCIYSASVGPEPGTTYVGREEVRRGFEELIKYDEKAEARGGRVFVAGDSCAAEWSYVLTAESGQEVEVRGCDLFEFVGDKISRKDAFRKTYA